jgi:hypothetical protein
MIPPDNHGETNIKSHTLTAKTYYYDATKRENGKWVEFP